MIIVNSEKSGFQALYSNTTGYQNTAEGFNALFSNTTGFFNTAVGENALYYNTGAGNTALGYNSGTALTTGSNNIDIGSSGVAGESNVIRLGDGSTQTDTYLTGTLHAGSTSAPVDLSGRTGIGTASLSNTALYVKRFGSTEVCANFLNESGNSFVLIGYNGAALYAYKSQGSINRSDNGSTWDVTSDERMKHDIRPVAGALATLERLRPVRFHYNADFLAKSGGTPDYARFGVVAQEFQKVFPDFVDTDKDGMLSVRMDPIPIVTAAAVQELDAADKQRDATIAVLQRQNDALAKSNQALEARLTALEARFNASQPPTRAATPTH